MMIQLSPQVAQKQGRTPVVNVSGEIGINEPSAVHVLRGFIDVGSDSYFSGSLALPLRTVLAATSEPVFPGTEAVNASSSSASSTTTSSTSLMSWIEAAAKLMLDASNGTPASLGGEAVKAEPQSGEALKLECANE